MTDKSRTTSTAAFVDDKHNEEHSYNYNNIPSNNYITHTERPYKNTL